MSVPNVAELREQLFRALAVLHVARLALTSKTEGFDPDVCAAALEVAHEMVDHVASALEVAAKPGRT